MGSIQGWAGFSPFAWVCRSAAARPSSPPCRRSRSATRSRSGWWSSLIAVLRAHLNASVLQYACAALLVGYGLYRAVRARHPRWVGMRVGFRDLTLWSFLMASAHGAGLMLIPVFLATTSPDSHAAMGHDSVAGSHASHLPLIAGPGWLAAAVVVHTLGHLVVAGLVALLVYEKLGLTILKTAWFNIDFAWALALIVTGIILAFI